MDLLKLTALELGEKIKAKEVTVREAVDAVIGQIRESESEIHSFVTIDEEGAYAQAEEIQKNLGGTVKKYKVSKASPEVMIEA